MKNFSGVIETFLTAVVHVSRLILLDQTGRWKQTLRRKVTFRWKRKNVHFFSYYQVSQTSGNTFQAPNGFLVHILQVIRSFFCIT